jgi:hypothetical protein
MNERSRDVFLRAGLPGKTFTERAPDAPNQRGGYHFGFAPDGSFVMRDEEGDALVEWDSYNLAYRALSDSTFDQMPEIEAGRCRYTRNAEQFGELMAVIDCFRSALKDAIAETEARFDVELPKYG